MRTSTKKFLNVREVPSRSHRPKEYNKWTENMLKRFNNRLYEVEQQVERPNNGTHQDGATNTKRKI